MKLIERAKLLISWLGGREPFFLLIALIAVAAVWGFVELADEVLEGETMALDKRVVRAMRQPADPAVPIGPVWLHEVGRDVTALGSLVILISFTAVVAGYLWLIRKTRTMIFLLVATSSGLIMTFTLKYAIGRPRPDVVPDLSHLATSSFPSGHSMLSAVVYLTLGAILSTILPRMRLKIYVLSVAILLTVAVGVSRVYLGVHYPTDVLAGWMAGLAWALLCWLIAHWLQNRGAAEKPDGANAK